MKVGIFHSYLHNKLKKRYEKGYEKKIIIKREELRNFLGWFNVPLSIQVKFVKEMEEMGLLKAKDKQNVVVMKRNKGSDWFE